MLPYRQFHDVAENFRYDVERLSAFYSVSYETIAHRLSTLQRPSMRGVPLSFVRVDRAGNMSKRQSATGFHFSSSGGTCPLWNVYETFANPGKIGVQIAQMPDGRNYMWVARTVERRASRYGQPGKTFAIGLGCELRHAHRLVYSEGLELRAKTRRRSARAVVSASATTARSGPSPRSVGHWTSTSTAARCRPTWCSGPRRQRRAVAERMRARHIRATSKSGTTGHGTLDARPSLYQ